MMQRILKMMACLAPAMLVVGCASNKPVPFDYTAFKAAKPRSILVLPPLNNSPEVNASRSVYAQVTYPLAEAGYYVMPVALVDETFKQNGLTVATDIHALAPAKLNEIFGADAAMYIDINKYGATYTVLDSVVVVSVQAKLVDLKTGTVLWTGTASASNNEGNNNSGGGLIGALVAAAVKQVINSTTDQSHPVAGVASMRLLSAGSANGMLYGPRSPQYSIQH
ncbi:hypothetical protein GTP23_00670 [Pseudoduganella sp. FT93W]|uniref:Lipoprotein n=1 Tax=Duganella fentianensis TaxID=2692177 RepID=A0A845HYM0_9BURK|nr:DUF799 domain-containing protein [Duganella fentianensis]MYN43578.1 hypothetical protein [Duganella fentianensis]